MENLDLKNETPTFGNVLLCAVNKVLCFFIGHNYKIVGRSNGDIWGWNNLECKRCKTKSDTIFE